MILSGKNRSAMRRTRLSRTSGLFSNLVHGIHHNAHRTHQLGRDSSRSIDDRTREFESTTGLAG
jgi:hypothetical protein